MFSVLKEIVNGVWGKENRLSELKTELAAVDRKIQLSISPESKEKVDEEFKELIKTKNSQDLNASMRQKII